MGLTFVRSCDECVQFPGFQAAFLGRRTISILQLWKLRLKERQSLMGRAGQTPAGPAPGAQAQLSSPCHLWVRMSFLDQLLFPCQPQFLHTRTRFGPGRPSWLPLLLPSLVSGPSRTEPSAFSIPSSSPSFCFRGNPILCSATRSCVPISFFPLSSLPSLRYIAQIPLCPLLLVSSPFYSPFYLFQYSLVISGRHLFISC